MSAEIVVVGSLNADFVITLDRFPRPGETLVGRSFQVFPGGKGANQAYGAARLGRRVAMVGQVGTDAHGEWLKQNLANAGVDISHVRADHAVSSGIATITIDERGQNQIIIVPGANGTFTTDRLKESRGLISGAKCVLLQLEIPIDTVLDAARWAREAGALVILDPAPACELPNELLACADYVTPNESELALLTGAAPNALPRAEASRLARNLLARGAKRVLVKMGAQGALCLDGYHEWFWPALPVQAVDTTAAGDAFNAAFAAALAAGNSEEEAGRFASTAAALSVTRAGAQPSMPALSEVENLLKNAKSARPEG
jgi:ribokinase